MEKYIHPTDEKIKSFIKDLGLEGKNLEETTGILLKWFDAFVTYSRLDAPFFPLQRSDLDVLNSVNQIRERANYIKRRHYKIIKMLFVS